MSLTYAPDVAPELEPGVVHWQPPHKTPAQRETQTRIVVTAGAVAVLALTMGVAALAMVLAGGLGGREASPLRSFGEGAAARLRQARRPF